MKIPFKRIVCALCVLALCASLVPFSALAEPAASSSVSSIVQQAEDTEPAASAPAASDAAVPSESAISEETADSAVAASDSAATSKVTAPESAATSEAVTSDPAASSEAATSDPAASSEAATPDPAATAEPTATPDADVPQPAMLSNAANAQRAVQTISVKVGQTIPYTGSGSADGYSHSWKIDYGSGAVSISGSDSAAIQITGLRTGTASLLHTYDTYYWFLPISHTERINVVVTANSSKERPVYLFVAKPGNTTLSNDGADYYYLANGGNVSAKATTTSFVKSTTNEKAITQYVDEWPTTLDYITGTSSDPVDAGSWWIIDSSTGEISSFDLILDGTHYTSEGYGMRWAKFSYADTKNHSWQYHADAILYEKQTVEKVLKKLDACKALEGFSLDENGDAKTSETFTFSMVDMNGDTVQGDVNIQLTATLTKTGIAERVNLTTANSSDNTTVLAPGRYMIQENLKADDPVWKTPNTIVFELNTDGSIKLISNSTTITNTPKTYTLSYDLNGGTPDNAFAAVSNLKYNAKRDVASETPVNDGNVFMGWSTTKNGTVSYQPGQELQITGDITLYAVWAPVSVTKALVLSNTPVDTGISKADYATVQSNGQGGYVTYTTDGNANILYKVTVNAYKDAVVTIEDTPAGGTVSFVTAVDATTTDGGKTFTMDAATATLYYAVSVTSVSDKTTVSNQIDWTIASQTGHTKADDVTVIKTAETAKVEKSITKVTRGEDTIDKVTDTTILRVGDVVSYQIQVTNTGNVPLVEPIITDTIYAAGALPTEVTVQINSAEPTTMTTTWEDGTLGNHTASWSINVTLQPKEVVTITYDYTVVADDASTSTTSLRNAAGIDATPDPTSDSTTNNKVEVPSIEVAKSGKAGIGESGAMQIAYTITVTNTGNAALTSIHLQDDKFPTEASDITVTINDTSVPTNKLTASDGELTVNTSLDAGSSMTVSYVYNVTEQPKDDGTLTVDNAVDVTASTEDGATTEGNASESTEVYSGTVDLALAPIVIYTGGTGFNQAIVGSDGQTVTSTSGSGLPVFGFTMTLNGTPVSVADSSEPVAAHLYDVADATNSRVGYEWSAIAYNANATVLMQLTPEGDTDSVRIQLTDDQDKVITSDAFDVADALCETYDTELYVSEQKDTTIIAEIDGLYYNIHYTPSTLTVRGTTPDAQTNKVVNDAAQLDSTVTVPQAVVPADATYSYVSENGTNGGQLAVSDTSSVSLLVDEIVDQAVETDQQYVQMMKDKVEAAGGLLGPASANANRTWRFFYMDLVLANNGNAVLTTDKDVTIYWPYAQAGDLTYENVISGKYKVSVVHYVGLNRNYTSSSFTNELNACKAVTYTVEATPQGLRFTVPSADGFSPFALVYETATTVTPTSTPSATTQPVTQPATQATATPTAAPVAGAPATGDAMPLTLTIGVAAAAAVILLALLVLRRRRRNQ